jgi:hypothetical protein
VDAFSCGPTKAGWLQNIPTIESPSRTVDAQRNLAVPNTTIVGESQALEELGWATSGLISLPSIALIAADEGN